MPVQSAFESPHEPLNSKVVVCLTGPITEMGIVPALHATKLDFVEIGNQTHVTLAFGACVEKKPRCIFEFCVYVNAFSHRLKHLLIVGPRGQHELLSLFFPIRLLKHRSFSNML